jgi:predicted Zn-dependent protease
MSETVATLFETGLKRYQEGEQPETLIPLFKEICDHAPKNATAFACLAWLYMLVDKPKTALKFAQKSVKIDARSPQARVNLALAMLDSGHSGVRSHIEAAQQMMRFSEEIRKDIEENIEDGLTRKPDWKSLQRVKNWLLGDS